jgi:hypothetical protein
METTGISEEKKKRPEKSWVTFESQSRKLRRQPVTIQSHACTAHAAHRTCTSVPINTRA